MMTSAGSPPPAIECVPYPEEMEQVPLKIGLPGRTFLVALEDLFDHIFRNVGSGSFEESFRNECKSELVSASDLQSPAPWSPDPARGAASSTLAASSHPVAWGAEAAACPQREVFLRRGVVFPMWIQLVARVQSHIDCHELYTLNGLGQDRGFTVTIKTRGSGIAIADTFIIYSRYRAVAVSESTTQLDAEFEVVWHDHSYAVLEARVDGAILDRFRRTFEAIFLPLVAKTLAANRVTPTPSLIAASAPVEDHQPNPVAAVASALPTSGFGAAPPTNSLPFAIDDDTAMYELRVEVVAASDLEVPEYRFGDFTTSFLKGSASLLSNVYVQLQVGERKVQTACADNKGGERSVGFIGERALFDYKGEPYMTVTCYDKRNLQAVLRGDPVIGRGWVSLGNNLRDCLPRWVDVPLARGETDVASHGTISTRLHFLKRSMNVVAAPNLSSTLAPQAPPQDQLAPRQQSQVDTFLTPPSSPRQEVV